MSDNATMGLIGVVAGALITGSLQLARDRQQRKRAVTVAATRCLDRLEKIKTYVTSAEQNKPAPSEAGEALRIPAEASKELEWLGPDMDEYLRSIGAAPRGWFQKHYPLYKTLRPVLIEHRRAALDPAIAGLKDVLLRDTPS